MRKRVVIIGGGFAGVNLARNLANSEGIHVILVDRNNYNFFPPLLYQVATGFLEVSNISYPFRKLFHKAGNVNFRLGELLEIRPAEKRVLLSTGLLEYDFLVLATGTESNFFGMENIRKNSLPMKTLDDAIELRNFLFLRMEKATLSADERERRLLTTIVVAGGGPTGVEVAGLLAEMRRNILDKDYPELGELRTEIYLVDGAPSLLTAMSEKSRNYTYDTLLDMGVHVKLGAFVTDFVDDEVIFSDGEKIPARTLIWAAGVTGSRIRGVPEHLYGPGNRIRVDEYNRVVGMEGIAVIGDASLMTDDPQFPQGHPQLAQVAIQQGELLAENLKAMLKGGALRPFRYKDKGAMAIIGKRKATAEFPGGRTIRGFIAWILWLVVHLFSLINYRNRITTMYHWAVSYFTRDQSLRMIIRPSRQLKMTDPVES